MGGGGVMRTAVKAAGIGYQNAGIRGLPENFSIRRALRPQASSLSSSAAVEDSSRLNITASSQPAPASAWELDDWDSAGYDVEEKPRLVFGPAPSLEETKEATSELRDALDLMYFSPTKSDGSCHSVSPTDAHSVVSESATPRGDTKTCYLDHNSVVSSVPNHALQAFSLLRENAAAQNVVASIAADPNVWDAVLKNEALKEYLHSEKKCMESEDQEEPLDDSADLDAANQGNFFIDLAQNVKHTVAEWVNNMSSFFHDLFSETDSKTSSTSSWSPDSSSVCGTLFALASMVIMLVVLKRVLESVSES
ncbi:hypothetical protein V2J09_014067 [Rumex salicifolius]